MTKRLAIVGSGSNTRGAAPWDDLSFDIWVFNEAGNSPWCKRWSAVFQMHEPEIYAGHNTKDPRHWEWLQRDHGKPVYMQEVDPRIPNSVRFPLEDAIELTGFDYFASSFAYMAALAIMQGYKEIRIYGIELSVTEYLSQADCWRFWIGFLKGRLGAQNVTLNSGLHLFESPRYGYEGNFAFGVDFFQERAQVLDANWNSTKKNANNLKKAIDRAVSGKEFEKVQDLAIQFRDRALELGKFAGALAEAERYAGFGDRYADRGGFELSAALAQRDGELKRQQVYHLGGMVEYAWTAWKQTGHTAALNQMLDLIGKMSAIAEETGALLGKYEENILYIQKYDSIVKAGGAVLLAAPQLQNQQVMA